MDKKKMVVLLTIGIIVIIMISAYLIDQYQYQYYYDNKNMFSEISYTIPKGFKKDDEYHYTKYYTYSKNDVYCNIDIDVTEKDYYKDVKEWVNRIVHFNLTDKISNPTDININNIDMYYVDKKNENAEEYYYGMESSHYFYMITYKIRDSLNGDRADKDNNLCYTAKEKLLSSIIIQ